MARKRTTYLCKAAESEAVVPIIQINLNGGGGAVTSVNGMVGDVVLDAESVGAVSGDVTINGKPLTEDVELTAADVGAVSTDDVATRDEAQEVLDEVYGQGGGIAPREDAQAVLDDVFGQGGGIASKEDAQKVLDEVYGENAAAPPSIETAQVASVRDARQILKNVFGGEG